MIESSKKIASDRVVSPMEKQGESSQLQDRLRPTKLDNYIGQDMVKKHLRVSISSAQIRKSVLDHILFYGPPGIGKTTLSAIIASEMQAGFKSTSGPAIEKQSDLVSILSNLESGDILFIDEIHRLRPQIEEILYTAMEDGVIDIMVGSGTGVQSVKLPLEDFTLVGATTRLSSLSAPLRDRFGNILKLDFYNLSDIATIIEYNAEKLGVQIDYNIAKIIAGKSRGTPRIANRLLKIIRDYQVIGKDIKKQTVLTEIFDDIGIDHKGLDYLDRSYLSCLGEKFSGGPVGLSTLAAALGEEEATLEEVVEPYLLQIGFIERTPRGRKTTGSGKEHFTKT